MRNILFSIVVLATVSCSLFKPNVVVIPDSNVVEAVPGRPGYFIVSGGHLKSLFEQQRLLVQQLEKCQLSCKINQ